MQALNEKSAHTEILKYINNQAQELIQLKRQLDELKSKCVQTEQELAQTKETLKKLSSHVRWTGNYYGIHNY